MELKENKMIYNRKKWVMAPLALSISLVLTGCFDSDDEEDTEVAAFTLQLLHVADIDGSTSDALAYAGTFASNVSAFTSEYPDNTLFLSSGDNLIPGSLYDAAEDDSMVDIESIGVAGGGRAHIAMLNEMGLQASAVGNHDLDEGTAAFVAFISSESEDGVYDYVGAQFPYLSVNLDFSADSNTMDSVVDDGQAASSISNSLAGTTIIEVDGETIGIIGATTPTEEDITSTEDITVTPESDSTEDLAEIIQEKVDELTAQGINKIILLAHMQQISVEEELATLLTDVDIIVAGGSNTLLANDGDDLLDGDEAADSYPVYKTNPDGIEVPVVNVDGDYKYLGRLVVGFDEEGTLLTSTIDDDVSGPYASDNDLGGTVNTAVNSIVSAVEDLLLASEGNILGHTDVYINGTRAYVRTEETNLGDLTADANLWYARLYDDSVQISLKNGGGIRADIGYYAYPAGSTSAEDLEYFPPAAYAAAGKSEGDISQYDIQTALAFNNSLTTLTVTASELKALLEHGVSEMDETAGRFPQVAGICFEYDSSLTSSEDGDGERVTSITLDANRDGDCADDNDTAILADGSLIDASYTMVSLTYLVSGGDSYSFPSTNQVNLGEDDDGVSLMDDVDPNLSTFADTGSEQDALAEYLLNTYPDADSAYTVADDVDGGDTDLRIIKTND
jgi:2',3'-cyclic-nucleotide 2'-phosphodiesterase (5'-nucleotidase family)